MFNKKLKLKIKELEKKLEEKSILSNYNEIKIQDDFLVLNQVLDFKISHYEKVVFVFKRYQNEKKVNVSDEEINQATVNILTDTFKVLSETYIEYLSQKYFNSREAMIDIYTQRVYMRLFAFGNEYNAKEIQK